MDGSELWFEFEVTENRDKSTTRIPAESYKEALQKLQRVHPTARIAFIQEIRRDKGWETKPPPHIRQSSKPPPSSEKPKPQAASAATNYWDVLGVPANSPLSEVKKAYVLRLKEYHPDRVADMGPEIRKLAEQKTVEIMKAFQELQKVVK